MGGANMRIVPAVLVAICFLVGATAEAGVLDRLKTGEALRLGVREDAAPYSYRDELGKPAGYSVELCGVVARDLKQELKLPKLQVSFVPVTAESGFSALQGGT